MSSKSSSVLDGLNLKSIAKYIKSDKCKDVFVLAGAGISTSAGIPDFRSPETGLYANLEKFNLPYPEAVFDINFFRENPAPFYALAKELEPGKYRPTLTHAFIRLLSDKGLLHTCFTQNIDTLERKAGIPEEKIIEAHGSFATHACINCKRSFPDDKMAVAVETQTIPRCERPGCGGLVKPNIVFFGEGLPPKFFDNITKLNESSLTIILGTSLSVYPFAALPGLVPESSPRLLINLEEVGDIGSRPNDVIAIGDCDGQVRKLCQELGDDWEDELDRIWSEFAGVGLGEDNDATDPTPAAPTLTLTEKAQAAKDAKAKYLEGKIEAMAREVEERLKLTDEHTTKVVSELSREHIESAEGTEDQRTPTVKAPPKGGEPEAIPETKETEAQRSPGPSPSSSPKVAEGKSPLPASEESGPSKTDEVEPAAVSKS